MPTVTLSSKTSDKAVFGVVVSEDPLPKDHWYMAEEGERFGGVNALGEGRVWVTNLNGDIEAGDYITTSDLPGYGQLQNDDLLHSSTLGKAIETVDWGQVTATVEHDGETYKGISWPWSILVGSTAQTANLGNLHLMNFQGLIWYGPIKSITWMPL
jgi:hypothetical protein